MMVLTVFTFLKILVRKVGLLVWKIYLFIYLFFNHSNIFFFWHLKT